MTTTNLSGIPETMLWTLHNRANEAMREDAVLHDEDAVRIYRSIDYDYERSFRKPDYTHAFRSLTFDEVVRDWMAEHPGGTVVELGCGLETQFRRIDDGEVKWLCVDVPEAVDVRERFLQPEERCRHVRKSALDLSWMDEVEPGAAVFVSAQGLLMYFEPGDVERLITAVCERFPGVELMFDIIPPWASKKTLEGLKWTDHYTAPPMPWGVKRNRVKEVLRSWSPRITEVKQVHSRVSRGFKGIVFRLLMRIPGVRNFAPGIVRVWTSASPSMNDASVEQ